MSGIPRTLLVVGQDYGNARKPTELALTSLANDGIVDLSIHATTAASAPLDNELLRDVDLLHTVGSQASQRVRFAGIHSLPTWVHTIETIALAETGRPTKRWVHRDLTASERADWFVVHGSAAWRALVSTRRVDAVRVHCAPVLRQSVGSHRLDPASARKSRRRLLELLPGSRVVAGSGSLHSAGFHDLSNAVRRMHRPEVTGVWLTSDPVPPTIRRTTALRIEEQLDPLWFLAAADVFVDTCRQLDAVSMAPLALSLGIPVVASPMTSAAELLTNGLGLLVPTGDGRALSAAIIACIARPRLQLMTMPSLGQAPLAQSLCQLYGSALSQPLSAALSL